MIWLKHFAEHIQLEKIIQIDGNWSGGRTTISNGPTFKIELNGFHWTVAISEADWPSIIQFLFIPAITMTFYEMTWQLMTQWKPKKKASKSIKFLVRSSDQQ